MNTDDISNKGLGRLLTIEVFLAVGGAMVIGLIGWGSMGTQIDVLAGEIEAVEERSHKRAEKDEQRWMTTSREVGLINRKLDVIEANQNNLRKKAEEQARARAEADRIQREQTNEILRLLREGRN